MKTLAVLPARLAATRLPRKPLRLLGGAPLIVRVWQRVCDLGVAERVVVATDSDEIAEVLERAGAEWQMTSSDHVSGTDRVAEIAAHPAYRAFDLIVNVQGDEPFVAAAAVRGALELVHEGRFAIGTVAARARPETLDRPSVVKVVSADDGRALYFSRAPIPWLRERGDREIRDANVRQHVGVYAYTREALARWVALPQHPLERIERLEQLRPLAAGLPVGVAVIDEMPAPGIDTEDDLTAANQRWNELYAGRT